MTDPIYVDKFRLQGFRAYLKAQEFKQAASSGPLSLAIYAPNAKGKTSLVDAFEFYFSEDATLERLGKREADGKAGPAALSHVQAETVPIDPEVHIWFRQGRTEFGDARKVERRPTALPPSAGKVKSAMRVSCIVRGYELRGFVEAATPQSRYQEISRWFGLSPLLEIQKGLNQLRRQLNAKIGDTSSLTERLRDLSRATGGAFTVWNEQPLIVWINTDLLHPLDASLTIAAIDRNDPSRTIIAARKTEEEQRLGLTTLRLILTRLDDVYKAEAQNSTAAVFEAKVFEHQAASSAEQAARASASTSIFNEVWLRAKEILENPAADQNACPVCEAPYSQSPHQNAHGVAIHIQSQLTNLHAYQRATAALSSSSATLDQAHQRILNSLQGLIDVITGSPYTAPLQVIERYKTALIGWTKGAVAPDATSMKAEIATVRSAVAADIATLENGQGSNTYSKALSTIDALIGIREDIARIERVKTELQTLRQALDDQAGIINRNICKHIEHLVGKLKVRVNAIYNAIQGSSASGSTIRLDLPPESETDQQRIFLRLDFTSNRAGVAPGGYLSDSQIHTLALSLRLAAIEMFNPDFPFVILDDVVTSYDADHRKTLASLLATEFLKHQFIIVTHDEQFFRILPDHLPTNRWQYKRITHIAQDFGPKFHDHQTDDAVIEQEIQNGESAANDIRQAQEDWLFKIGREFGVSVRMRAVNKPYEFSRAELAKALAQFLKDLRLTPPSVPGITNPFLNTLINGTVENFGSHFTDNPQQQGSEGDERARWQEFKYFRDLFRCSACGKKNFHRPEPLTLPLCKAPSCNTPFAFGAISAPAAAVGPG